MMKSVSIFLLLLLLISPSIERTQLINEKPILSVLIDNSASIKYFKQEGKVLHLVDTYKGNKELNSKFTIDYYRFGNSLNMLDSLSFDDSETNIFKAIVGVDNLQKSKIAPVVLISDGNQTTGSLYSYIETSKNVFPIIIGDTLKQTDIRIDRLNSNKYSYLNNKFPIECSIIYEGFEAVNTEFRLYYKKKIIFKKKLSFDQNKNVETIRTHIRSNKEGVQYYTATVQPIKGEKNVANNRKTFSLEVLNQQTKILILSSIYHPDLGALKKAIETNKQRTVQIEFIKNNTSLLDDFQLVILYQPNNNFKKVFDKIKKMQRNYLVITGTQTSWGLLNSVQSNFSKKYIDQVEDYGAILNKGFLTFGQKELPFESYPPLKDVFGEIEIKTKHDALLFQNISGIETSTPLFAMFENTTQKSAVLFGENIWKWRAASFINTGSFQDFDAFISNSVQYLASTTKRDRLTIELENIYAANSPITITAFYVDKNYRFDGNVSINLKLTNTQTQVIQYVPFSLQENSFEVTLDELPAGDYNFNVSVDDQNINKTGSFKITAYKIEEQFVNADKQQLLALAQKTNGKVFHTSTNDQLIENLLHDSRYFTTQKITTVNQQLIEWEMLLLLVLILFTVEWFVRKYHGKI